MKRLALLAALFSSLLSAGAGSFAAEPLRVFIRSGPKSHGPGAHDHPSFLRDWVPLLNERGAKAVGGNEFPTKEQLDQTDVLVLHTDNGGDIKIGQERKDLLEFLKRGGGIVTIHAASVSKDHDWFKNIIGGSWHHGQTKWLEGPMHLYFTDKENPITKDMSNFAMDDEIYYDMDVLPEAKILAGAYTPKPAGARNEKAAKKAAEITGGGKKVSIYDIQPQVWTYEKDNYRSFVSIPGHYYENFNRPNFRAMLLRGIAWAGKRENTDELCKPDELGDNLRYVEGGPTHPEKAAEKLEVHPEFNISLVASEPLINKVMNVDWDEKGRLWVVETPEYPNGRRELNVEKWKDSGSWTKTYERDPIDRISWLEDTNGDGVMDKKHVFADKLELCTSFCFYKNGVIACAAPDIWNLQDTNGDGIADKREKLYTGLGTGDTHAVINNLRWGLDGWVYATHGYSSGRVTSPDGSKDFGTDGSGVVRFKPDGSAFEQYASRSGNTWGLDITWDGQVFFTQPTSGTVFFHVVLPEYVLAKGKIPGTTSWKGMVEHQKTFPLMSWPEQAYVQIDLVGEFTAAAGCAIYEGGAWPAKWNYSYFTTEPTLNIVHHQFVEKDGVSYKVHKEAGREETEFIRSKDLWFRPIETRVGPDGALYVVDFYNQAVIHNDTRGPIHGPANAAVRPDRDHYFGRIWKVQHKEAKKLEVPMLNRSDYASLTAAIKAQPNAHVKKQALRLVNENHKQEDKGAYADEAAHSNALAIKALAVTSPWDKPVQHAGILNEFEQASDDWTRSALIAAVSNMGGPLDTNNAFEILKVALARNSSPALEQFTRAVLPGAFSGRAFQPHLIEACANAHAKADALKIIIIQGIAQQMNEAPLLTPELTTALKKLLAQPALAPATLPLAVKWDKSGALAEVIKTQIGSLTGVLGKNGAPIADRIGAAKALISLGSSNAQIGIEAMADPTSPEELKRAIIAALDDSGNTTPMVMALDTLPPQLQQVAFDAILKRPEATLALLASIGDGKLDPKSIGPGNIARLRTHPNKQVAKQANAMMDKLNPNAKAKNELIAQFTPIVEQPGDAAKGKLLFTAACAICHRIGDIGKDVAPPLVGMGAHGPAELLIHVMDPNREVDPSYWAWNITKKNGETLAGVIASENAASVTLRNQAGDFEVKKGDIKERINTKMSLMPEGLEGLGAENIRDILAFICGGDQKFRVLDLRNAYTADTRQGSFAKVEDKDGTVTLHKFGNVTVEGIPFFIMDPEKSSTGANIIVLKGGYEKTFAWDLPTKVEIPASVTAASLHMLGGVAAWAWPFGGDDKIGQPAMTVHVDYADGDKESIVMKNGEHFADYIGKAAVPLSDDAGDFTRRGQLRYLAVNLKKKALLKKITLETSGSIICPCTIAITASAEPAKLPEGDRKANKPAPKADAKGKDKGKPEAAQKGPAPADSPKVGGKGDGPLQPATPVQWEADKTKVLIIGGGSSHNFAQFMGATDSATLKAAGFTVHYTEDRDQAANELANADVAVISVNRKFFDTVTYRKALMDFAAAGKGIIMLHPGVWYGFAEWPEINAQIVGGGARGHDKIHPFDVKTVKAHPIMEGVPASFMVEDELYYVNAEPDKIPAGTAAIEVLAETSPSDKFKVPHSSVWITKHPTAKVVGIALGHDARTHDLPAYQKVLSNAVKWASGK